MARICSHVRADGSQCIRVTVTTTPPQTPPSAATTPAVRNSSDAGQSWLKTDGLQPMRMGHDVYMMPAPQAPTVQRPRDAQEPSAAERAFLGFCAWLGGKLDGL